MTMIQQLIEYLNRFVGTPYHYGGKNPLTGFDCSGLICEGLISVGILPFGSILSAQQLYDRFSTLAPGSDHSAAAKSTPALPGNLAVYGKDQRSIDHVGLCIGFGLMLEAGGGTPDCVTLTAAIAHSAFVKVRPIRYRKDFFGIVSLQVPLMAPVLP